MTIPKNTKNNADSTADNTDAHTDIHKSYETAIEELEKILTQLESSELPLEEAIKEFESGVSLIKHCQAILDTTEQKIKGLTSTPEHSEAPITSAHANTNTADTDDFDKGIFDNNIAF